MKLNKTSAFVLMHLLGGVNTAAKIAELMPSFSLRSIQRALVRLTQLDLITRKGVNNPLYSLNYEKIVIQVINEGLLDNTERPISNFNFTFLDWLKSQQNDNLSNLLNLSKPLITKKPMTARDIQYLIVELSWKSSALEGNTYSLLDTELLLTQRVKAQNKTNFETQMILNHQTALEFIFKNPDLFNKKITSPTVLNIHKLLTYNLDIKSGIRKKLVRISASNYQPLSVPTQLKEILETSLTIINQQSNHTVKALLAFSLIPYLQAFEDGNKRLGRILANAILIHSKHRYFSLKWVNAKQLALAYLSFYEFNSLRDLSRILKQELQ